MARKKNPLRQVLPRWKTPKTPCKMTVALAMPTPLVSIESGIEHSMMQQAIQEAAAAARKAAKAAEEKLAAAFASLQEAISYSFAALYRTRSTRRPCKYPFYMVEDARKMRANGYEYKAIAEALGKQYEAELKKIGVQEIPWITVRDWTGYFYRMRP